MKLVVLDGYTLNPGDLSWKDFEQFADVTVYERTEEDKVAQRLQGADFALTNKALLMEDTLKKCPQLKYIGVLATGYNVVDIEAAHREGITVTNIPKYASNAVAQFVFSLLLEVCNQVGYNNEKVHEGKWAACKDFTFRDLPLMELYGKTFGLIGMGGIGRETAKIAEAFQMKVIYTSRTKKEDLPYEWVNMDTLLSQSDVISINCPLTKETENLINKVTLNKMKSSSILINTARGPIINEDDLYQALKENKIYAAALDVLSQEPPRKDNKLTTLSNCIITPHIAWAAIETRERLMKIAFDNFKAFVNKQPINTI